MSEIPVQKFTTHGYEAIEKIARTGDESSARVNVPLHWTGKRVIVIRIEE